MYPLKHLLVNDHQRDATQCSLSFPFNSQVPHLSKNIRADECLLPSTILMCSSPFPLCRLMEKCSLGYRMELLVVMAPVCSDVQGVSSVEASMKKMNSEIKIIKILWIP